MKFVSWPPSASALADATRVPAVGRETAGSYFEEDGMSKSYAVRLQWTLGGMFGLSSFFAAASVSAGDSLGFKVACVAVAVCALGSIINVLSDG